MPDVVDALEEMFRARARGEIVNRPRVRVPITAGTYNVMPAGWIERGVVGQKMYTASAKGASFQIVLYGADGSGLLAVMGGGRISGLRTGARHGPRRAAPGGPSRGGPIAVIGAGFQATAQVNGLVAATGATDIRVYGRTPRSARRSPRGWRSRPASTSTPWIRSRRRSRARRSS